MAIVSLIEYADAAPEVRAVYDEIMRARGTDWVNNFWKALAHDPALLRLLLLGMRGRRRGKRGREQRGNPRPPAHALSPLLAPRDDTPAGPHWVALSWVVFG